MVYFHNLVEEIIGQYMGGSMNQEIRESLAKGLVIITDILNQTSGSGIEKLEALKALSKILNGVIEVLERDMPA